MIVKKSSAYSFQFGTGTVYEMSDFNSPNNT